MSEKNNDEFLWHLSMLSAIAGPFEAVLEGDTGVAWAVEEGGEWWMRLFKKEEQFLIHMDDSHGDRLKMMTIAGYARHCADNMQYTIGSWDEFLEYAEQHAEGLSDELDQMANKVKH